MNYALMGRKIYEYRIFMGWTRGDLARCAGISCRKLKCIERGRCKPNLAALVEICATLRVSVDYIIGTFASDYTMHPAQALKALSQMKVPTRWRRESGN